MLVCWQSVLVDLREHGASDDDAAPRWPPSWRADREFVRGTGPVRARTGAGAEYLTSEATFADLGRLVTLDPSSEVSPLGGRPFGVVKRLYPLDRFNRTFTFSVVFRLPKDMYGSFKVSSVRSTGLPSKVLMTPQSFEMVSGEDLSNWVASLHMRLRGKDYPLAQVAQGLAAHLASSTAGRDSCSSTSLRVVGHAIYLKDAVEYVANRRVDPPALLLDRLHGTRGRPWTMVGGEQSPVTQERRLRVFMMRTVAELDIGTFLMTLPYATSMEQPQWYGRRLELCLNYLSREAPYGFSGALTRRLVYRWVGAGQPLGQER